MSIFTSAYQSIQQDLSDSSLKVQPRGIDIAMLPAVSSMFESNINSGIGPDNQKKQFLRMLSPAIRKWSSDAVEELEHFAREQLGLPPRSKPSRIPSVIFQCKLCSWRGPRHQRFRFDEALSHHHLYEEKRRRQRGNTCEMTPYDKFKSVMGHDTHPRDIRVLRVDVPVSRRVENLITRMGQNPNRVTYDELRHSTVKVVCGLCPPQVEARVDFEHAVRRSVRFFLHC